MARSMKAKTNGCNGAPSNKKKDNESKKRLIDGNRDVDPQLWHAVTMANAKAKFDETIEAHIKPGIDSKRTELVFEV
ncbi:hypothetical protein KIW84_064707 [Lathyrus oleraceus]|uniref:Uncharacterized protein n=1 Tax=Pisum sativum TaxID=3888 RepID=A0A9D5A9H0_PEA|nr:hypothetical protein KIW84_064707 [Pisum sativum]